MKSYILTISILFSALLMTQSGIANKIVFASKNNTVWFQVEKSKNDLVVESNKFKRKQIFYLVKNNIYRNKLDAVIEVLNENEFLYDDPNHRLKFKLYRENENPAPSTFQRRSTTSPAMNTTQLEGTWFSSETNKKLALVSTREGFKIKFSGSTQWTEYVYNKDSDYFLDQKGNKYVFKSLDEAEWFAGSDNRQYNITRIANTIEY